MKEYKETAKPELEKCMFLLLFIHAVKHSVDSTTQNAQYSTHSEKILDDARVLI